MMTELEAVRRRTSRRAYGGSLAAEQQSELEAVMAHCNVQSELAIRFMADGSAAFTSLSSSYGMFSGVRGLFLMIGRGSDPHLKEKVGKYGEELVLQATRMGLGTCWVGGTFNKDVFSGALVHGQELVLVITVGPVKENKGLIEKTVGRVAGGKKKPAEELFTAEGTPPDWFMQGMEAVALAPSAMNRQPVRFAWKDGQAAASVPNEEHFTLVDLGIAKRHFEIAAGGSFALGNGAAFEKG